ncbi:hypothetical protein BN7_1656 [Wickerhamomyces ciferrii]|uniref:Uncharacterized protein n=1 Tax=Wickerhamomyces ciferrii (strain ATCC 14091 / BCRC 22168 / CBS 111 / JCM 3599 / NBRC 0793 / NRRL Y-1031 F-60-10) TaxID=1206466 RepID=K0KLW1_WICCF|nr:uncharacterized protein BN7_1656 [Wickerhamomyces ciferrii]CCH42113.1 hypothetical protein BN7_1656 [Wickerhamomyces ciferrii]
MMSEKSKEDSESKRMEDKIKRSNNSNDEEPEKSEKKRKHDHETQKADDKTDLKDDNVASTFKRTKSDANDLLIKKLISQNKEKIIQNFELELVSKSSTDVDINNFYKDLDHETIKFLKKDSFKFIIYAIDICFNENGQYFEKLDTNGEDDHTEVHLFKLIFLVRKNKLPDIKRDMIIHEDKSNHKSEYGSTMSRDSTSSILIKNFKEMVPKPSCKFDQEILRKKFILNLKMKSLIF